jgi:FKBP-type peptidyl-prolyl cis-trans isomerase FklB
MNIRKLFWITTLLLSMGAVVSCSESDDEDAVNEFANWQQRNDAFFASLEDSLKNNSSQWKKIKSYTKNEETAGLPTEYIYAKVIESSYGSASPLYTDSVRVAYRGRLIPTTTYPEGYVFEQTYVGNYSEETAAVSDNTVSGFKDGFATALQHMQKGDHWRVYMPYQLMYGASTSGSIPAYSVLIFDMILIDFTSDRQSFYPWTSRKYNP